MKTYLAQTILVIDLCVCLYDDVLFVDGGVGDGFVVESEDGFVVVVA